jgi:hypothetical protein
MDGFFDSFIEFINGGAMSKSFNKFVNFDEGFLDSNEGYKHKKEFSSGGGNEKIPLFFLRDSKGFHVSEKNHAEEERA